MKTIGLTKIEAIKAMMAGKKVRHKYFSPDEWVTIEGGHFLFEDGVKCSPTMFWMDRYQPDWQYDWEIVKE